MPRRHPRPDRPGRPLPVGDGAEREEHPDGIWAVRRLSGVNVVKAYRCPGCQQEIPIGAAHTVAWSADGDGLDRRHWHNSCWAARDRRHPPGGRTVR